MSAQATARVSTARAYPAPARQPAAAPRLRLVRAPQTARTRVPFVLACMAVLAAALLSALLLNTQMASGAYEKYGLSNELGRLDQDAKDLQAQLDQKASPAQVAAAARALGMVPADGTGWVRVSDGTVQGSPAPAAAGG
ncbi:hypothetical protein [Cellulomonas fimi]|uniref:Cell division protein FtsL n=1 Tax=Cellulomonas fimi (strain ATCC 484 / DSM 20113 / JCM 1341 / CCUG 24087 / LMG 16345 / NBRC 15513 / NCIMB 8980 / NCTC 7547 / NRS-133) TaxID=590998 RepID=F4H7Q7_CELFA|nr:hypothetical protein [Cellulomonas fimi]AEE45741.1 hypothetical protein Celf_1609 [Cellulomonas fimi ATCC 484]NNH08387.1 hypothetical protein [Cellulomonas fimi]VEH30460.1 Uncharacterised protein [Cellulomonas fimi]